MNVGFQLGQPLEAQVSGSFKRKRPGRVARLVPKNNVNLPFPSANYQKSNSYQPTMSAGQSDMFNSFTDFAHRAQQPQLFSQPAVSNAAPDFTNYHTPCIGQVCDDRICFRLVTRSPTLYCPFAFTPSSGHRAVLVIDPPSINNLPFVLNEIPFSYSGIEIDLTEHLRDGENHFVFNTMSIPYTSGEVIASIQWRFPQNLDCFVMKIVNEFPQMEVPAVAPFLSDMDPISKAQIHYPGRGANCAHCQCFDLKAFLSHSRDTGIWNCPICGKLLSFNDLRYDPSFLKNCGAVFALDDFADSVNGFI